MQKQKNLPGFTLVEILVVVALIAILATLTIVALNPAENFKDTRNTQRSSHVNTILNGVSQYLTGDGTAIGDFLVDTDYDGTGDAALPLCTANDVPIALNDTTTNGTLALTPDGLIDLHTKLVTNEDVIVELPVDPRVTADQTTAGLTGYTICKQGNRVVIKAPNAEDVTIEVKR